MKDLIERLAKAKGPDRELDIAIAQAIYPGLELRAFRDPFSGNETAWYLHDTHVRIEHYTASLDAAMTLVPEGAYPGVVRRLKDWEGYVNNGQPHSIGVGHMTMNPKLIWETMRATTAAVALTGAALKYRAAMLSRKTEEPRNG